MFRDFGRVHASIEGVIVSIADPHLVDYRMADITRSQIGIDGLNALSPGPYASTLCPNYKAHFTSTQYNLPSGHQLQLDSPSSLSPSIMDACFDLVESTSFEDYTVSSIGWNPASKRREMRLPDLRYLTIKKTLEDGEESLEGFLSFMLTYEDGKEVVYCYELHLRPHLQGRGIGKHLVTLMEEVGSKAGVEKAMLTVFLANKAALAFYERLGYEEDDFSPRPRKLRNGIVKRPDYVILSKSLGAQNNPRDEVVGMKRKIG